MRIRTITAASMTDALQLIRQQLGPEALILSTRKVKNAAGEPTLEITAAINEPDPASKPAADVTLPEASAIPASITPQGGGTLAHTMAQHGLSPALAQKILAALPGLQTAGFNGEEALEMLLAKLVTFKPLTEVLAAGQAHLFIGPPGAGKTTLIAKLAVHTRKQGRTVGLLSLDDKKIGGFEPLAIAAEILGDSAHLLTDAASLKSAAAQLGPRHVLLIDTPGFNPYQPQALAALHQRLAGLGIPATTHLVVPADLNAEDMATLPVATHRFGPASLAVTRLDCTTRYGAVINTAAGGNLPLSLAGHSGDFAVPPLALTPQWLAQALATLPRQPWEFTS
jgi:flagellar biosynthesis protein FlhF